MPEPISVEESLGVNDGHGYALLPIRLRTVSGWRSMMASALMSTRGSWEFRASRARASTPDRYFRIAPASTALTLTDTAEVRCCIYRTSVWPPPVGLVATNSRIDSGV